MMSRSRNAYYRFILVREAHLGIQEKERKFDFIVSE
jgi:hypothetical protein